MIFSKVIYFLEVYLALFRSSEVIHKVQNNDAHATWSDPIWSCIVIFSCDLLF
jgi:hypothetical protein